MSSSTELEDPFDRAGVTIFIIPLGRRFYIDDGRKSLQQFIDKLREYGSNSNLRIESAHYEPAAPMIFVNDLTINVAPMSKSIIEIPDIGVTRATRLRDERCDPEGIIIYDTDLHRQSDQSDGRRILDQFIDLLRHYGSSPGIELHSAHYEPDPDNVTFFVVDSREDTGKVIDFSDGMQDADEKMVEAPGAIKSEQKVEGEPHSDDTKQIAAEASSASKSEQKVEGKPRSDDTKQITAQAKVTGDQQRV